MSLRVLSAGTHSLIVDAGRPRTRGLGVSVGGPADRAAWALGNALVGNPPYTSALEVTLSGPTLVADADTGMCVFGCPFRLDRGGEPLTAGHSFTLEAGQTLRIGGASNGCRAYLCVPGGFRAQRVLDSTTAFEPVRPGDVLNCDVSRLAGRDLGHAFVPVRQVSQAGELWLRVLPGPQRDWFDDIFFVQTYQVTPASNRMGVRLDGEPLALPIRELISEPVAPGAVQIANDGKPIILGVDGQTTGGYPKIAHVIAADLDAVGQLRPGDTVHFQLVTESLAEDAAARQREELRRWLRRLSLA